MAIILLCIMLLRGVRMFDDTLRYMSAMQQIQGKVPLLEESDYTYAVIPLLNNVGTIVLSVALGKAVGSDLGGLVLFNSAGYLLIVFFFYQLSRLVFSDDEKAAGIPLSVIATILVASNYALLMAGPGAYLVDSGGWIFYFAALYCAARFHFRGEDHYAIYGGALSMIGIFFKESGGIAILTIGVLILITQKTWKEKLFLLIKTGSFFIINIAYHVFAYITHGYLYLNRYTTVINDFAPQQSVIRTAKILASLYLVGWPISLIGAIATYSRKLDKRNRFLLSMIPSAFIFFAYPAYDQRISFVAVPFLALLAGIGLAALRKRFIVYTLIIVYVVSNFWILERFSHPRPVIENAIKIQHDTSWIS